MIVRINRIDLFVFVIETKCVFREKWELEL
jgi:hypothetical protein